MSQKYSIVRWPREKSRCSTEPNMLLHDASQGDLYLCCYYSWLPGCHRNLTRPEISGTTSGRPQHGRGKHFRRFKAQEIVSYTGRQQMNLSKHSSAKRYPVLMIIEKWMNVFTENLAPSLCAPFSLMCREQGQNNWQLKNEGGGVKQAGATI